jgi:hypothetical protein
MAGIFLQKMLEDLPAGSLPTSWSDFDLEEFSHGKALWDYQQESLQKALLTLWKYYSRPELNEEERKQQFFQWYLDAGMEENLDLPIDRSNSAKRKLATLLEEYYLSEDDKLPYWQFINRMGFWMATGSGKTLVIVKIIEVLSKLMSRGEIPNKEILMLTHRDDLLEQLKLHVAEFNTIGDLTINLHELRDYNDVRYFKPRLSARNERDVFYYRSDNLSDERKERIIDFRSYDNNGNWYILLDEAHKGDKEDSKRQHIYSIMARNGFLFNFSATFTDVRDITTTAFNFNLSEFIRKGYGKHIYIVNQETKELGKKDDFTESEKQKIVLKALMLLTVIRQMEGKVKKVNPLLYHRPLLMTLVNSVNTEDADLKLFFRELVKIGKREISTTHWQEALDELRAEFGANPVFMFEDGLSVRINDAQLEDLKPEDVLEQVFNSRLAGEIEILARPSDRQELALKLKTSEEPFALIRIGDVSNWLSQELTGYEINAHFNDESFFERLNKDDSDINLLLGSRSFYEGWDSNRPNVIMYINIGVGTDAKKFILQSVGRGARIEPLKDHRKRLSNLLASGLLEDKEVETLRQVQGDVLLLESEFIFGTNRSALQFVIDELNQEDTQAEGKEISLDRNDEALEGKTLLVPVYRQQDLALYRKQAQAKFALSPDNLDLLKRYMEYIDDDRVLLALYNTEPEQVFALRESVKEDVNHFRTDGPKYRNIDALVNQVMRYTTIKGKEFQEFKVLKDEINHYLKVKVKLDGIDFERFQSVLKTFKEHPNKLAESKAEYIAGQLSLEEYTEQVLSISTTNQFNYHGQTVKFKRITQHYYLPLIISEVEKLDYLNHIIKVKSEVDFLSKLEEYLKSAENLTNQFDWWMFSRLDETTDQVNVPYYNPIENKILNFKPDFIFWIQKGQDYHILFIDPKGTGRTEYEHKVDGFRNLFEKDEKPIIFEHQGLKVQVHLFLHTADTSFIADYYRRFWLDDIKPLFENLV